MKTKSKFTRTHRFFHWSIAFTILLLFLTGFLRMTWMSKKGMAGIISQTAAETGITGDQAIALAKSIRAPMWQWHIYAAWIMIFLFLGRIIYMMAKGIKFKSPLKSSSTLKEKIEGWAYILFYIFVGINVATGFFIYWSDNKDWKHTAEFIHKWAIYWFPIFLLIHFIGIFISEIRGPRGLASKIIGGEKQENLPDAD